MHDSDVVESYRHGGIAWISIQKLLYTIHTNPAYMHDCEINAIMHSSANPAVNQEHQ